MSAVRRHWGRTSDKDEWCLVPQCYCLAVDVDIWYSMSTGQSLSICQSLLGLNSFTPYSAELFSTGSVGGYGGESQTVIISFV